jgi:hypothetical protein
MLGAAGPPVCADSVDDLRRFMEVISSPSEISPHALIARIFNFSGLTLVIDAASTGSLLQAVHYAIARLAC